MYVMEYMLWLFACGEQQPRILPVMKGRVMENMRLHTKMGGGTNATSPWCAKVGGGTNTVSLCRGDNPPDRTLSQVA